VSLQSLLFDHIESKLTKLSAKLTSLGCVEPAGEQTSCMRRRQLRMLVPLSPSIFLLLSFLFLDVLEAMQPWRPLVQPATDEFLNRLYDVAETLHRAVYFVFLKVCM